MRIRFLSDHSAAIVTDLTSDPSQVAQPRKGCNLCFDLSLEAKVRSDDFVLADADADAMLSLERKIVSIPFKLWHGVLSILRENIVVAYCQYKRYNDIFYLFSPFNGWLWSYFCFSVCKSFTSVSLPNHLLAILISLLFWNVRSF